MTWIYLPHHLSVVKLSFLPGWILKIYGKINLKQFYFQLLISISKLLITIAFLVQMHGIVDVSGACLGT